MNYLPDGQRPRISVVIPAYNEVDNIPGLLKTLEAELKRYASFEVIIVDDGSSDGTLEILRGASSKHRWLRFISFSKNFGHQAALRAGLLAAVGDCAITMDADLQHPPQFIHRMVASWESGARIVLARRKTVAHVPLLKRVASAWFYKLLSTLSDAPQIPGTADFRLLDRVVLDALARYKEADLFLRGILPLLGFPTEVIDYEEAPRTIGRSKYSWRRMVRLALTGVLTTSTKPLRLASLMSFVVLVVALTYTCYAFYVHFVLGIAQTGWTSLIIVVALLGAMQLFVLGIIGEYLAQVLRETRERPPFIVAHTNIDLQDTDGEIDACSRRSVG
jgi:glycosyltransferase involved in cell wall biosynthesis